jgi:hypothetical protein
VVERSFQGSRAPAGQKEERLSVKEQRTCHFPMWYLPMHRAVLIAYIVSI